MAGALSKEGRFRASDSAGQSGVEKSEIFIIMSCVLYASFLQASLGEKEKTKEKHLFVDPIRC